MKKASRSRHGSLSELNVTPLLDLVFSLLIIFIITTPQMMNNLEMTLPSGEPPPPETEAPQPRIHRIDVRASGQAYLNDQPVTVALLGDRLRQYQTADPELAVVVKGSDEVEYQNMINVLDVLQRLEITKVGLATDGDF